jgi:hypothetical protein
MRPPPGPPYTRDGLGAVTYHTGAPVGLCRHRKRRPAVAARWPALSDKHPAGTSSGAWDHAETQAEAEVEAVVRAAAGRLVLLYLPPYRPWLNPIEMRWRQFRREVTHCAWFASLDALLHAAQAFFDRDNQAPARVLSLIGAHAA